ncbi:hypothetical protein ABK040_009785 [Willaertia magna]
MMDTSGSSSFIAPTIKELDEALMNENCLDDDELLNETNLGIWIKEVEDQLNQSETKLIGSSIMVPACDSLINFGVDEKDNNTTENPKKLNLSIYNVEQFNIDLIAVLYSLNLKDYYKSLIHLKKISDKSNNFKLTCLTALQNEDEYAKYSVNKESGIVDSITPLGQEDLKYIYLYNIISHLVKDLFDTHPSKDIEKRKYLLLNLNYIFNKEELIEYYVTLREKEIYDYVPEFRVDLTSENFSQLSKQLVDIMREDIYLTNEILDREIIVSLFTQLYLNKYISLFTDKCESLIRNYFKEHNVNGKQCSNLMDDQSIAIMESILFEYIPTAQKFQDNVIFIIDVYLKLFENDNNELSVPLSPNLQDRGSLPFVPEGITNDMKFSFNLNPTNIIDDTQYNNFVSESIKGIENEVLVPIIIEGINTTFFGDVELDIFIKIEEYYIFQCVKQILDQIEKIYVAVKRNNLNIVKSEITKPLYIGFSSILPKFEVLCANIDQDLSNIYLIYIGLSTLLYCINKLNTLNQGAKLLEEESLPSIEVVDLFPIIRNFYITLKNYEIGVKEFHYNIISSFFVPDIKYLMEWESYKKFQNEERCSYGLQMWYYYMKGICYDIFKYLPHDNASILLSEILLKSVTSWKETYTNIFPTSKRKTIQYKGDITCLVMFVRSFRSVTHLRYLSEITQQLLKLLVYMSLACCSLTSLISFIKNTFEGDNTVLYAQFSSLFTQAKTLNYIKGIPIIVWNTAKVEPFPDSFSFNEYSTFGSDKSQESNNQLEFTEIKNVSFEFDTLLYGCYICGIGIEELIRYCLLRCEFNDNDYPAPSEEEKKNRQQLLNLCLKRK